MSVADNDSFEQALRGARALIGAGRFAEAAPILRDLLERDAHHIEVRNALAVLALSTGDLLGARSHLTAALVAAPDNVLTLNQLAQLQQREGDLGAALDTYRRLLKLQPAAYASRIAYAWLLDNGGEVEAALLNYFRALRDAQQNGRWLSAESTPPGLRPAVARASELVGRRRRQLCDGIVGGLVQRFGADEMKRVAGFVAMQLGEAVYSPEDARQRPTRYPFPGLAQSPYLDKQKITAVAELEAQTPLILEELQSLLDRRSPQEKVFSDEALAAEFLRNEKGPAVWDGVYFYRHGIYNEANAIACPSTITAIERLPLSRVSGYGPEVLFSCLGPGTHLMPHFGVTNARVVGHLPLMIPADCALAVAGIEHRWKVGEVVVFDDTYSHEAWNRSEQIRVVMIFDMWHPELTAAERLAVRDLQESLGGFSAMAAQLDS